MDDPILQEADFSGSRRLVANRPVFFGSAGLIVLFSLLGALFPKAADRLFQHVQALIVEDFGWFYVAAVAAFLVFVLFLMLSRYGDIKLGPDASEPEYSHLSWFAMLFSAGMGIGLVFFGVAEPIQHFASPPLGKGGTVEAARQAMVLTFFHWGLHAWAIYAVLGLALAYFSFRRGLPLTIRSALFPLLGRRIYGPIGDAIDIFAVLGTMFGVATSLGLGVLQVNAGLSYLVGLPVAAGVQVILIAAITALATMSVFLGLDRGVKRLSELNIIVAMLLLVFVLTAGPTIFLLKAFVQNVGAYLGAVVPRTFRLYAYEPNPWIADWTLFYWGWWIAWSPFVGMFIARISRGRTIRQFVVGVLTVPVLFTFLWMTVFGNTAISMDQSGVAPIVQLVADDLPVALFAMLEHLPWSTITSALATLLIVTFFVTSADSGALVIDMITSGAADNPPVFQRIFWAICAGVVASVLLLAGGLQALQTAAITSALPFAVVMIFICYALLRGLQMEKLGTSADYGMLPPSHPDPDVGWQTRLKLATRSYDRKEIARFLEERGLPALEETAREMRRHSLSPEIESEDDCLRLTLLHGEYGTFSYEIEVRGYRNPSFAWAESKRASEGERQHFRAMVRSSEGARTIDITGLSKDRIINDIVDRYAHFRNSRRQDAR